MKHDSQIIRIVHRFEEKFIKENYNSDFYLTKSKRISELIDRISNDNEKKKNYLSEIRILSIEKGGLLNNHNRSFLYKFILNSLPLQKSTSHFDGATDDFVFVYDENKINEIIRQDCERSIFYSITKTWDGELQDFPEILEDFQNQLESFTKASITCDKNSIVEYYQGYNDLSVYMFLLLGDDGESAGANVFRQMTRNYFSHVTDSKLKISFDVLVNVLNEIIERIDRKVNKIIISITKTPPYYALSWILTWFAHNNHNLFHEYRLFDYFMCSSPMAIIFFSAVVIIDEFNKLKTRLGLIEEDCESYQEEIFTHFQNLDITSLDVENIIPQVEYAMRTISGDEILREQLKGKEGMNAMVQNLSRNSFKEDNKIKQVITVILIGVIIFLAVYYLITVEPSKLSEL